MVVIEITPDELSMVAHVAGRRKVASDYRRACGRESRRPEHYQEDRTWDQEIGAGCAEVAVAKHYDKYWKGAEFNGSAGTDVGKWQVRWTPHMDGKLLIYKEDKDDQIFILVVGKPPRPTIVGWLFAKDAKLEEHWRNDVKCPCWWVPQDKLFPIDPKKGKK